MLSAPTRPSKFVKDRMAKQQSTRHASCTDIYPSSHDIIFTGPRGLRDYRPRPNDHIQAVGIGDVSVEQTLGIEYLFRSAPGTPLERPRSLIPGEIGWGIPWLSDVGRYKTGHEIVHGEFRQAAEDKIMHENIGAWYPCPGNKTSQGSDKRKNFNTGETDNETDPERLSANQDELQPEVLYEERFRALDATLHRDMYRNC